jgi:hypothetical protein
LEEIKQDCEKPFWDWQFNYYQKKDLKVLKEKFKNKELRERKFQRKII